MSEFVEQTKIQQLMNRSKNNPFKKQEQEFKDYGYWNLGYLFFQHFGKQLSFDTPFSVESFDELLRINPRFASKLLANQFAYDVSESTKERSQLFENFPDRWKQIVCVQLSISEEELQQKIDVTNKPYVELSLLTFGSGSALAFMKNNIQKKRASLS